MKHPLSIEFYILAFGFVPCAVMIAVRNLKLLAPFCIGATIMSFFSVAAVMYYLVEDLSPIVERSKFGTVLDYPLFFGTVLFAISAIGVVSTI